MNILRYIHIIRGKKTPAPYGGDNMGKKETNEKKTGQKSKNGLRSEGNNNSIMDKLGKSVSKRPKTVIGIIVLISIVMMSFSGMVESDMGMESFTPDSDEIKAFEKINSEYGNTEMVLVAVEAKQGSILERDKMIETLQFIKRLYEDPQVNKTILEPKNQAVMSIPSFIAQYSIMTSAQQPVQGITIDHEINEISNKSDGEIKQLLGTFLKDPNVPQMYKDYSLLLLPNDYNENSLPREFIVFIVLDGSLSDDALSISEDRINDISKDIGTEVKGYTYGYQFMMDTMLGMADQMAMLFMVSFILIVVILFITFRTLGETLISFTSLGLAVLWAYGFLGIVGWKSDFLVSMAPILIIGIGVDFSIHSLMNYREKYKENKGELKKTTTLSIGMIGSALGLATLTTAIGFGTNVSSNIPSVQHYGIMAAVGILSAFVLNVTFVPAVKMLSDRRKISKGKTPAFVKREERKIAKSSSNDRDDRSINGKSRDSRTVRGLFNLVQKPAIPITLILLFSVFSLYGAANLTSGYDMTGELPNDSDAKAAIDHLSENFNLNTEFAMILVEGDVLDPVFYNATLNSIANLHDDEYVLINQGQAQIEWLGNYLKLYADNSGDINFTNQYNLLDNDGNGLLDSGFTKQNLTTLVDIAYTTDISSQYFVHKNPATGEYDGLVIRVFSVTENYKFGLDLKKELEDDFKPLSGVAGNIDITGDPIILGNIIEDIEETSLYSTLYVVLAAGIILTIVFYYRARSLSLGLLVSLPIFLVVLWIFGTMYMANLPLNMMTAMTGALTIGLGVDYTIHIAHRWLWEYERGKNLRSIHRNTITHTGRDLLASAATTATAFGILMSLNAESYFVFGFVIALAVTTSFIASVVVLPIFLGVWTRYHTPHENISVSETPDSESFEQFPTADTIQASGKHL
jgi:predicted RND superfamily exporter protein